MSYVAKPSVANSIGSQTFSDVLAAIAYLADHGVDTTYNTTLDEKIQELKWIGKLVEVHQMKFLPNVDAEGSAFLTGLVVGMGLGVCVMLISVALIMQSLLDKSFCVWYYRT